MHYICIKKNHAFISVSSEKIHAFKHAFFFKKKKKGRKKTKEGKCGESFIHGSLNLQECE